MKKWKIWLMIALSLILLGSGVFVAVLAVNGWDFAKLDGGRYETKTYEVNEGFKNISMNTDTADVEFLPAMDGKCKVVAYEEEKLSYNVTVESDTLIVKLIDQRKWYDHIRLFNFEEAKLTVYLSETVYEAFTLKATTGDVDIPKNFTFTNADIQVSTGGVEFSADVLETLKIKTSTGDIEVDGAKVKTMDLTVTTGDISVSELVCEALKISVDTGETELENVACKTLVSYGDTGYIELENVIVSTSIYIERDIIPISLFCCIS